MKSMTAFARVEQQQDWGKISWELRSVNQRYLEIYLKMAENLKTVEMPAREKIKQSIGRGKLEGTLQVDLTEGESSFHVDINLVNRLVQSIETVQLSLPEATNLSPLDILKWPGVLQTQQSTLSADKLNSAILDCLQQALEQLNEARSREGQALATILSEKINLLQSEVDAVKAIYPEALSQHTEALKQRIQELAGQVDDHRFHQEVAIIAQKADISEEIERLQTHLTEVSRLLTTKGLVGRRLDFLMQELNREANTLGSKAIDPRLTQSSVECKVLIEQMREQIQNIE
ncbi:YicC/YloC family endoribonuclease [Hydrogenovibrio sp. JE_KL2]|uniref:YicC/YloC family endoribonuclease n=1 Tax=Hydrogenovibrio sp. JE_KL2 TaxID=2651188 RepID=UPI00128B997A|nr:YicC/YloC family endoribonuclease [Hydrogenovibrio sp. JE_KL2]MPQ76422.1 YicC family protein [Hydrogenovibrio sp. JE_KL2]